MTGSSLYARTLTTKLAASTSMDVLCFDYRLAPENPYPAAVEDAMRAWNYLMLLGYGARDVIVAGDSAGGNLALSLSLKLKEEGRLLPRGLVLMSPWTDLSSGGRSHETRAALDPVLDKKYLQKAIRAYVGEGLEAAEAGKAEKGRETKEAGNAEIGGEDKGTGKAEKGKEAGTAGETAKYAENLTDPLISPLFGDFAGFPPTYIQVGDNEVLLDDATRLHKNMIKANVSVKLDVFDGMWHVFQMSPFKTAYEAMDKNAEFIYDICR